ncbi:MAG TPA: Rieske (2Fe-2S) protein [Bacteroidota bacterium]|nr:Rieske (2Fe-2S) protein [Bacteroidota bacterium]
MRRRSFIATACIACLGAGSGALSALLSSCAPEDVVTGDLEGESIRVSLPLPGPGPAHVVRANGYPETIALVTGSDGEIHALLLRCTHANNPLQKSGDGFSCSLHGSRFDTEGNVIHGPASRPLRQLKTRIEGHAVVIFVGTEPTSSR